ncbi:MAG TPA: alpha/beta fold hydrolase [Rudaea sp.]|nr:alpha/beta fold hydrolase [Rudaea sp.]
MKIFAMFLLLVLASGTQAAGWPAPAEGDYTIKGFRFGSGETLPELRMHYRTLGELKKDKSGHAANAVLIMHGTGGSGTQFLRDIFAGELFGPGQPLDAAKYYIVLIDDIGHGKSSKPSDGLHAKFPHYDYDDMLTAEHAVLVDKLGVDHLRLVMGTSMGGMHTWLWGEKYPEFMDALMPLASLPVQISGRNRMMRKMLMDSIRTDPEWNHGEYTREPHGLVGALDILLIMGSSPLQWQKEAPDRDSADKFLDERIARYLKEDDANDLLYQVDSSRDYDPQPKLSTIKAPLLAINSADDQINPPELGILEREIRNVPHGRAVVIPISDATHGHGTHTYAAVWKNYLVQLLEASAH